MGRSEARTATVDFGENTAGQETGVLDAGETVSSCTIACTTKPSGAADPTMGSVSVNGSVVYVNGRSCSAGEAVSVLLTMASDQTYGRYVFTLTATTSSSHVLKRLIRVDVGVD